MKKGLRIAFIIVFLAIIANSLFLVRAFKTKLTAPPAGCGIQIDPRLTDTSVASTTRYVLLLVCQSN